MRLLLVEDEEKTSSYLCRALGESGFMVDVSAEGAEGLHFALEYEYDAIILDVMLPGMDGYRVLEGLRASKQTPVLMLSARGSVDERVKGLRLGADDYLPKPFSARELVARVQVLLRRPRADRVVEEPARTIGLLRIEPDGRRVFVDAVEVEVTRTEFDLLNVLSARPRVAFTRRQVVDAVWGEDWVGDEHLVDVHVLHVRRKLARESPAVFVETVRGVGYRMGPCR